MIKDLIALDNTSRVWIYAADRDISYDELDEMRPQIWDFLEEWTAHRSNLVTYGNLFHRRFLCLFVDETHAGASGCSIDASVHFIQNLGQQYSIDFMDRKAVQFLIDEEVQSILLSDLPQLKQDGKITSDSLVFNNLVKTKEDFLQKWVVPVRETWVNRFL